MGAGEICARAWEYIGGAQICLSRLEMCHELIYFFFVFMIYTRMTIIINRKISLFDLIPKARINSAIKYSAGIIRISPRKAARPSCSSR